MATSEGDFKCYEESIEDTSEEESDQGSEHLQDNGCSEELLVGSRERLLHLTVKPILKNFKREIVLLERWWKHSMRQGAG